MISVRGPVIHKNVGLRITAEQKFITEPREATEKAKTNGIDSRMGNMKQCLVAGRSDRHMKRKTTEKSGNIEAPTEYVSDKK